MFTDKLLTDLIELLNKLAREYDPTLDYKLPVYNETWMEHARALVRAKLEGR